MILVNLSLGYNHLFSSLRNSSRLFFCVVVLTRHFCVCLKSTFGSHMESKIVSDFLYWNIALETFFVGFFYSISLLFL